MGGQCLVSSRSAVERSLSSGTALSPFFAVALRCLLARTLSLSSGVALHGEHKYYIFNLPHFMRNYFWNYLEEIISKNRGLGLLGNTLRIFAERTFLAAYPLLTLVAHPFFAERTSQSLFAERTLLQNFYECTLHIKLVACGLQIFMYALPLKPSSSKAVFDKCFDKVPDVTF